MTFALPLRRMLSLAALAAGAILASCAAPPPPAPPPTAPSVNLSSTLIDQASAYRRYVTQTGSISPAFTDGASVARAVRTGAAYQPDQLIRGAIAYGAVAALQDPGFVAGVRQYVSDPEQRRQVAYEIMKDPAYVVGIQGSASAAGLVMDAIGGDGRQLLSQGKLIKQAAYDVQHAAWSKADVEGRDARLLLAKQLSATATVGDMSETTRLTQALGGAAPLGLASHSASPPYTPLVIRSLAVAALGALGYANDESLSQVMPLMTDGPAATCLNMSKLNLYQCLAVAKPHYEDVFCLGQHVMMDTGVCLMKGAGAAVPLEIHPQPLDVGTAIKVSTTNKVKSKPKKR